MIRILKLIGMSEMIESIIGEDFKKFIDYCFDNSTYFTLTHTRWRSFRNNLKQKEIFERLKDYLVTTISTDEWFASYVQAYDPNIVEVYRTEDGAKKILLDIYDNLYLGAFIDDCSLPEDLCFFYKNKLVLGTSSHEEFCLACPMDKEMEKNFYKFGYWRVVDERYEGYIVNLSDYIDIAE